MKEEVIYMVDSLGVAQPEIIEEAREPVTHLFVEGGLPGMILITILLICLFIAAWKAPRWVKEIGLGALTVSVFWTLCGLYQMLSTIHIYGEIPLSVVCGGLKVTMISVLYGLIVYFISLILRIVQKPRI